MRQTMRFLLFSGLAGTLALLPPLAGAETLQRGGAPLGPPSAERHNTPPQTAQAANTPPEGPPENCGVSGPVEGGRHIQPTPGLEDCLSRDQQQSEIQGNDEMVRMGARGVPGTYIPYQ